MRFTQVAADAFQHLQLNAGMILDDFNPANPGTQETIKGNALVATSGGATFSSNTTYTDFGEDIDNVPANTYQLKRVDHYEPRISGTGKTANPEALEAFLAHFTKTSVGGVDKYVPRGDLADTDFKDIWWAGDYSDKTGNTAGGYIAIKLKNALNTGGFQLKSNDNGKGDFAFDFLGHYDIEDVDDIPFEVYVMEGSAESTEYNAKLSSLVVGTLALTPPFTPRTTSYTAATTASTNPVIAVAQDSTAGIVIKNGTTTVTNGNSASWSAGENTLTVTVTKGTEEMVYTVTVTKS